MKTGALLRIFYIFGLFCQFFLIDGRKYPEIHRPGLKFTSIISVGANRREHLSRSLPRNMPF
jgi:hypothetical protein